MKDEKLKNYIFILMIVIIASLFFLVHVKSSQNCPSCKMKDKQIKYQEKVLRKVNNMVIQANGSAQRQ